MNERSRAPGSASDRALVLATLLACALTLCAMFWPAASRRVFVYGDLGTFLLPMRIQLAQSLERGITPLWMPNLFCGYYAHGEGAIGIFHPLRWLLYRFLPFSEAFNLECLIPYPLALAGMTLFLRRLALPPSAALFGGASFAFCPYLTVRLTHLNTVAVIAHLGWLLFAIEVVLRENGSARRRAWLGLAFATGSQLLVGYPIAIAYCWLLAIPYALFVTANRREPWPLLAVASGFSAGLLLGAIQLVPTWDYWTTSERVAPSYEYLTEYSLHPWNLLLALAPWLLRTRLYMEEFYNPVEQALYFGPVVPIAASWVLLRWRALGRFRPLVVGLIAMSALALALALGKHTGVYRWIVELPVIGLLRVPARYTLVLYTAGAVMAAIAFSDLQRGDASPERERRIGWIWIAPAASWIVAALALVFRDRIEEYPGRFPPELASLGLVVLGPLALTLAAALFTAAVRGHRAALFGLVALALADHAAYAATLWWCDPPQTLADYRTGIARPPATPPERVSVFRTYQCFIGLHPIWSCWASTRFIVHDAKLVTGYAGLQPARRLDYSMNASMRVAGATTHLTRLRNAQGSRGGASLITPVYRPVAGALPRARLVSGAVRSAQPAVDIVEIDVATTALVDEPIELEAGPAGTAAIEQDQPGAIRIAVNAPTRQLLVLAESFHPGWRVAVDGAPARALRVNADFLGAAVDAGAHELQFRFAPRSYALGRALSLAGLAIVGAVALAGLRADRSRES